jgi:CRP-like cAMP-binding protein
VQAAGLSRAGLAQIMNEHPAVAAKLMAMLAARIAERLRALSEQLQIYARLTDRQADEIRRLKAGQGR